MLRRALSGANLGLWLGWLAGAMTALVDYGAHWLWLNRWDDRATLLLRLLGLEAPIGALFGAALGAAFGATQSLLEGLAARRPPARRFGFQPLAAMSAWRFVALALPGLWWMSQLLFTGGQMSRLPARPALQTTALLTLSAGVWLMAAVAHELERGTRGRSVGRRRLVLLSGAAAFACAKLNQWALPKLYDYLHAALALGTWSLFAAAGYLMWTMRREREPGGRRVPTLVLFGAGVAVSTACLGTTLERLERNQNVRVALLHPNMPHARATMQALAPLALEPAQRQAIERARKLGRLARTQGKRNATSGGPVLDDAHILFVTVDALRADHLGAYGYARPTSPNFDRLAQESVLFERAYAPAPHSSFSLCSVMTSEYLHETLDLGSPPPTQTLATVLAAAGYHTAAFYTDGIFHTAAARLGSYERSAFGFALHDQVRYSAEQLTDRVLQEADRTVARGEPSSLFWVHYFDVHEPYVDTHFGTADLDRYDSEIRRVDAQLDRLIKELRRRFTREIIVVVSADHGEEFYEHGGVYHGSSLYDEQVRIPLLIQARGLSPRRVAPPVTAIDVAPTLLQLVGLLPPDSMRGSDLRPLALGQNQVSGPVFSAVIHKKMVVRWPHKLIADLRFGLFELYDLERDPFERENLADLRPDLLAVLRDEVYGWLDSLAPIGNEKSDAFAVALDWGRLGDRRAVEPLAGLLRDEQALPSRRVEAARMLGHLADERATASLVTSMSDPDASVAAEAAVALGRMYDSRARKVLRRLVVSEDQSLRVRAAISLGRLRDPNAVPALIEALWVADSDYERQEAVRWLGRLRDRRALEPLIQLLPEMRTRYLVPVAIGMLGDMRGYGVLTELLSWDNHADVRDATVQGLGQLGNPRAISLILPLAVEDPSLKPATETLVRLGALRRGAVGGADLGAEARGLHDFMGCHDGPLLHDWDYRHRTVCMTRAASATLWLASPKAVANSAYGAVAALSLKRADASAPVKVQLAIGGAALGEFEVDGTWEEHRFEIPPGVLPTGRVQARISSASEPARFVVDHLLLLPRNSQILARH